MLTKGQVEALDWYFRTFSTVTPSHFRFDAVDKKLEKITKPSNRIFVFLSWVVYHLFAPITTFSVIILITSPDPVPIFQILFLSTYIISYLAGWFPSHLFALTPDVSIEILNGLFGIEEFIQKFQTRCNLRPSERNKSGDIAVEIIMKMVLIGITSCGFLIAGLTVPVHLDPNYPALEYLLGDSVNSWKLICVRYIHLYFVATEMAKSIVGGVVLGVAFLKMGSESMDAISNPRFMAYCRLPTLNKFLLRRRYVTKLVTIYRSLMISFNLQRYSTYSSFATFIIYSAIGVGSISNYGTIKLLNVIPFSVYLIMPTLSVVIFIGITVGAAVASSVHTKSCDCLDFIKTVVKSKYERKIVKSLQIIAIYARPFYVLDREFKHQPPETIIDNTINLLMSF